MHRIVLLNILISFTLISCSVGGNKANVTESKNDKPTDSIPYATQFFSSSIIPESDILRLPQLDSIENTLSIKLKVHIDSILDSINVHSIFGQYIEKKVISEANLVNSIDGDTDAYCSLLVNSGNIMYNSINSYQFHFYIAEKRGYVPAYTSAYISLAIQCINDNKENFEFENKWSLGEIDREERDLALLCLIRGYRLGEISCTDILSYYLRNGFYMPQNIKEADMLDAFYDSYCHKENTKSSQK